MKDIELPPLPDADVTNSTNLLGYRYSYSAIAMQAYARAAIEADRAQRVPDGWKLVPVEPTDRMLNAASLATESEGMVTTPWLRKTIYFAMLASTPAPAQQEPGTPMDAHRAAYFMRRFLHEEKMLGPNEQAALHFTIAALEAMESAQHQEQPQQERKPMTDAARDVLAERQRQISAEGWTPEHDDEHTEFCAGRGLSELARAAKAYIEGDVYNWPWTPTSFKPSSPRRNLVKAGALILAEIERLDRATTE